jgi:MFS family permease
MPGNSYYCLLHFTLPIFLRRNPHYPFKILPEKRLRRKIQFIADLQYIRGLSPHNAGLILIVQACVQCAVSFYAGRLSDKLNPATLATVGMGIIVAGLTGLIFVTPCSSMIFIVLLLFLLGFGFGLFSSPNSNVIMSSVDKRYYGQASATMGTMRLTGQAFSMGIATMAISFSMGNKMITTDLHADFMKSFHITFIIFAALCVAGTYTSSFRVKKG